MLSVSSRSCIFVFRYAGVPGLNPIQNAGYHDVKFLCFGESVKVTGISSFLHVAEILSS